MVILPRTQALLGIFGGWRKGSWEVLENASLPLCLGAPTAENLEERLGTKQMVITSALYAANLGSNPRR